MFQNYKNYFSVPVLIAANIVPLIMVLFFGANLFEILILYWSESAIIGFFNIIKMALAQGGNEKHANVQKLFLIPFFMMHYGIFMSVHLVFILILSGIISLNTPNFNWISALTNIIIGFISLFASHAISFFTNYIGNKEYKTALAGLLIFSPYGRIIIMHLTILFGMFIFMLTGYSIIVLVLLIILKTLVDLGAHLAERSGFSNIKIKKAGQEVN
ncbi:MAG: DUF6498-containing protein [archaeon]